MVEWLKRLVTAEGNAVRDRSYTNWNTLDVSAIIAEKRRLETVDSTPEGTSLLAAHAERRVERC
jgi:hypothetical protein